MKPATDLPQEMIEDSQSKWDAFCSAAKDANISLWDDFEFIEVLKRVFAFSNFIARSCTHNPAMLADLVQSGDLHGQSPPDHYNHKLKKSLSGSFELEEEAKLSSILRKFRLREIIRIAWRDLAGRADLSQTMADLSALADACINQALSFLYEWACRKYGIPTGHDGSPQHLVILGMGKLGGGELNFSSDVDLIFAYPAMGQTSGVWETISNEEFFVRLCRRLIKIIGSCTSEGIVFRVDMNLRPYGESGPLVMSFDAMEAYYQEQGREWERYAWIKARVVAGDNRAGAQLLERLKPFVYRRYLDFGAFESLRNMKQKISFEVKRKHMSHNIKLGLGGIREIEFFSQIFQLIRGGVAPALQEQSTRNVLKVLARENYIPQQTCDELTRAYEFLRNTEHRLQEFSDQQTHEIPADSVTRMRLAASMGFADAESFTRQLEQHRRIVHYHFNQLLGPKDSERIDDQGEKIESGLEAVWKSLIEDEQGRRVLADAGFENPDHVMRLLDDLRNDPETRLLSSDGRNRLDKLMPVMLKVIGRSEQPLVVLSRILDLIKVIERRTNYLALLLENRIAIVHLVKLAAASPWVVSFLALHPVLLDELLDPRTLYLPLEKSDLKEEIRKKFDTISAKDLEYKIQELCIFKQANILRVAAADVTRAIPLMRTSDHLSEIAETVLNGVVDLSWDHLAQRHGIPKCQLDDEKIRRGFAVIAYGKLGGLELGYGSDLDLVFLHAGTQGQTRGGKYPIDNAQFFARLGQRVVHILTAHTPAGVLYQPDMRLRPSGSSGILVSHIQGFKEYQMNKAWTWEHQAIIKARPISGDIQMAKRFEQIRNQVIARPRIMSKLQEEVVDMRDRMRRELL
ncbi:MAG: bifunctional [glutamate--ammonia ligase]-adenylyl-L-tyrosine phosphorylase/[glutamate--ammonia-ligase] adenylyltransferase, partial [Thermodesulfobacteriota bacterium]|nr:bifunctional [glutamate--ammonia ligase]-adenylyl-L-tyrosine phosphorylase/[glutamate--ammonia-ligase] adenylyltransferase [Thermodesulfobacteriota bacterium]